MMKKLFPYILIVLIFVQMLMPFTIGSGTKNNLEVRSNKAEAEAEAWQFKVAKYVDGTIESTKLLPEVATATPEECATAWTAFGDGVNADGYVKLSGCTEQTTGQGIKNLENPNGVELKDTSGLPVCSIIPFEIGGCIAQGMYYLFFKPTSFVFGLSGKALDFTLKYSLDDTSYRSSFVVEGWGLVRDFCNMFFIFILLYIAFGTILNLHSVKTKEMIINVVIIGLLINFSLFATQVIIDASNILARVFYNQNTIVTGTVQKDAQGNPLPIQSQLGDFGEIKLSEAIVSKVNPVSLITNAQEVNTISTASIQGEDQTTTNKGITTSSFIIVVLLATFVNIVGTIAFISCALVFIGRVLMLWLAMILAPLAFFSYTVPALQNIKMIGWKQWWPDTLKMAFVAPVFAFFMYIIVGFLGKGLDVINASLTKGYHGLSFVIAMIVPFAFIMILLMKAKSIAVSMSGEVGSALSKVGATVGGLGLAAVTGGAAMAMRGTVGKLGNKIATSEWASTHGAVGRTFGNLGKWTGSKSFDVRATKLGATAGKELGVDMGKAKEGGYAKHLSDKVEKRQKRAKELEVHENEPLKQTLNKTEMDLQGLLVTNAKEIESVDKLIEKKRQEASDAERNLKAATTPEETANAKLELTQKNNQLTEAKERKTALREGKAFSYIDDTGIQRDCNYDTTATSNEIDPATGNKYSIDSLEKLQKTQAQDIKTENATRKGEYARDKAKLGGRANKEAEHKIIMDTKLDSGTKT